jgi:hypothetical protein
MTRRFNAADYAFDPPTKVPDITVEAHEVASS